MKHIELFAGIGGFRKAIELLSDDFNFKSECIAYSEIDPWAIKTYNANFITEKDINIGDIVSFVSSKSNINSLNDFDLITGGFPCQSFSMMGQKKGFEDVRGNVFFDIMKIASVKKPQFILLENVKNLLAHDCGRTIEVILNELKKNGYPHVHFDIFNTQNFGLAQKRNRLFIFASRVPLPKEFQFTEKAVQNSFTKAKKRTSLHFHKNVLDVLAKEVEAKYYLSETLKPTILSNGTKNFKSKSEINQLIARPLTATMVKMHRACQDNYYSYEFLNSQKPQEYAKIVFSKDVLATHKIRKITPHEAFLLQGFDNVFTNNAVNAGVSNHQLYKQAGNAVSVNTVYAVLHHILIENKLLHYVP
jgi:DNA (cytosine-5)-methyltransferase 1